MAENAPQHLAPSPQVRVFEKDVGSWDAEIEVHTPAGPQRSKGSLEAKLLGGMWLITQLHTEQGFEGHGVFGWDPTKNAYVGTWVDGMRTFLAPMTGHWDAARREMTFTGEADLGGGRKMSWREVTTTVDADTQRFVNYVRGSDGKEYPGISVTYRRRTV